MQEVTLPSGDIAEFPDYMSKDRIESILSEQFPTTETEKEPYEHEPYKGLVPAKEKPKAEPIDIKGAIARHAPRVLGGIAGGLAASPGIFTTPWGVLWGSMAGEAGYQIGQQALGQGPKTSHEAATGLLKAGWEETKWELAGGWGTRAIGKVLAPFAKSVTPEAAKTIKLLKGKIKPVVLTPVEATENWALDILGNISEYSIFGGGAIQKFKLGRQEFFNKWADDIINHFGPRSTPEGMGDFFVTLIKEKHAAHREFAKTLYNNVESLAEGVQVSTKELKNFAGLTQKVSKPIAGIESKNAGDDLIAAILGLPDQIDFTSAKELRSRLISRVDEFSVINKKAPAIGKAKHLIGLTDTAITKALPDEALEAWRGANAFYKFGEEKFNNTIIRRLLKFAEDTGQGAEFIGKNIFKAQAPSSIRKIKRVVSLPEWKKLQSFYVQRLFIKSVDDKTGAVMGDNIWKLMFGKGENAMGEPALKVIFNPEQLKDLSEFTTALKLAQAKQAQGLGRMFIQLTQGGAIAGFATGFAPEAGVLLFSPFAVSKLLLNRATARWLTQGFKIPATSPQAMGIAARLLAAQRQIQNEVNNVE